ncbi:MAG: DNA-directed RNA polymerase subunit B [Candidatus Aenigmarchaeota archaeon]|nr:DNA-directed RNA polymerase subunit B [Candidatus Aenigmarchaeota archaeon]
MSEVYVNGYFAGEHDKPLELVKALIEKRRGSKLPETMNVAYHEDKDEVQINVDSGRVRRPLVVVNNGKALLTVEMSEKLKNDEMSWADILKKNIVEYIDAEEEENAYIAVSREELTAEHTHMELDASLILGVAASVLVFPEKNRGDRLNYGSRMAVQSMGIPLQNFLMRDDTTYNVLVYPQVPIVKTDSMEAVGLDSHPSGHNLVIAVSTFYGYNVEDALIVNKASLERGIGRSVAFRSFVTEFRRYWGGQEDEVCIPDGSVKGYRSEEDYEHLDEQGIVEIESKVPVGGVLVGKISPLRFLGIAKEIKMGLQNFRDNSLTVSNGNQGIVEKVVLTSDSEGNKILSVVVRDTKTPEVGDKMATRHGQKGVIGLVVPEEDMPFTADGIVPDIIVNPHAMPSRMTVGQLLEIVAGKVGALAAKRVNGTVFRGKEEDIRSSLKYLGFRDDGKETLYNGITGEKMGVPILMGITYYYRLYHLVSKKIHARSKGPVALMTKQPTEGRSKEGGLRLGEMEKDCFIAHGAPITLRERFGSDKVSIPVCKDCGVVAIEDHIKNKKYCPLCKNESIVNIEMAYAFKLMLDELKSLLIYPQIIPENS